jgi:hypothetical protein
VERADVRAVVFLSSGLGDPTRGIQRELEAKGVKVKAFTFSDVGFKSLPESLEGAQIVLLLVGSGEVRRPEEAEGLTRLSYSCAARGA